MATIVYTLEVVLACRFYTLTAHRRDIWPLRAIVGLLLVVNFIALVAPVSMVYQVIPTSDLPS